MEPSAAFNARLEMALALSSAQPALSLSQLSSAYAAVVTRLAKRSGPEAAGGTAPAHDGNGILSRDDIATGRASTARLLVEVKAWLVCLQQEDEDHLETPLARWLNDLALPILRSPRDDGAAVYQVLAGVVELCAGTTWPNVASLLLAATDSVMGFVASCCNGNEAMAMAPGCARWLAAFIPPRLPEQEGGGGGLEVIRNVIALMTRRDLGIAARAELAKTVFPSFAPYLPSEASWAASLSKELWQLILKLHSAACADAEEKALAYALLCILYDGLVKHMGQGVLSDLWTVVQTGLDSSVHLTRKRALHVVQRLLLEAEGQDGRMEAWWQAFVEAYHTLETEQSINILDQVQPSVIRLVEEAFEWGNAGKSSSSSAEQLMGPNLLFPEPDSRWAEILLSCTLRVGNQGTRKRYIERLCRGEPAVGLDRLSIEWVLGSYVEACADVHHYRGHRVKFSAGVSSFLAQYLKQCTSPERRRALVRGVLAFVRDQTKSSHVRLALLGMAEHEGFDQERWPCLCENDLALVSSVITTFVQDANARVLDRMIGLLIQLLVVCTDYATVGSTTGPDNQWQGFLAVQDVLSRLPHISGLRMRRDALKAWIAEIGRCSAAKEECSINDPSFLCAGAAHQIRSFISVAQEKGTALQGAEDAEKASTQSEEAAMAVAPPLLFLTTTASLRNVVAPALDTWSKLHKHPYVPAERRLRSLQLLASLGCLSRSVKSQELIVVIGEAVGELMEYTSTVVLQPDEGGSCSSDEKTKALWTLHADVLGTVVFLFPRDKRVLAVCGRLLHACFALLKDATIGLVMRVRAASTIERIMTTISFDGYMDLVLPDGLESLLLEQGLSPSTGDAALLRLCEVRRWGCLAALWRLQEIGLQRLGTAPPGLKAPTGSYVEHVTPGLKGADWRSCTDVLYCMGIAVRRDYLRQWNAAGSNGGDAHVQGGDGDIPARRTWFCEAMEAMWKLLLRFRFRNSMLAVFLEAAFSPLYLADSGLVNGPDAPLKVLFRRILLGSLNQRTHLVGSLASRCIAVWGSHRECDPQHFASELAELLILRREDSLDNSGVEIEWDEDVSDVAAASQATDMQTENTAQKKSALRVAVLAFLTFKSSNERVRELLRRTNKCVVMQLLKMSLESQGPQEMMINSISYSRKLRVWQALCVLADNVNNELIVQVNTILWPAIIDLLALPPVRHYQEMFASRMCQMHPNQAWPILIDSLHRFDLRPQVVATLLSVAGYLCLGRDTEPTSCPCPPELQHQLLQAVQPWLGGTHNLGRIVAQLLLYHLIPFAIKSISDQNSQDCTYLRRVLEFLEGHREMQRMRETQKDLFRLCSVRDECSLEGLLCASSTDFGDFEREHVFEILKRCASTMHKALQLEDGLPVDQDDVAAKPQEGVGLPIQRKIITSYDLLELECQPVVEGLNARGRPKQDIIVCASLIDRLPNLAGLARTCEVFAASKLILPDLNVVKTEEFVGISVSAAHWVALEQVRPRQLPGFLQKCKQEEYTIVGLEQTSTSVSLATVELPKRMVLLLGKEKEGIPVELLHMVDQTVEIPQLGIVRSLNVHVSGAISLWEYSKQHADFS